MKRRKYKRPKWLNCLCDEVLHFWESGPAGCSVAFSPPTPKTPFWILYVHPALTEIRGPHENDGKTVHDRFNYDLLPMMHLFEEIEFMVLDNGCNNCGEPAEMRMLGDYHGHRVGFSILMNPPPEAPVELFFNTTTGELTPNTGEV